MAKPAEVEFEPGWLKEDIKRAQSRLNEWRERVSHSSTHSALASKEVSDMQSDPRRQNEDGHPAEPRDRA